MTGISTADLRLFLPELILGATVISLCLADTLMDSEKSRRKPLGILALVGTVLAYFAVQSTGDELASAFYGSVAIDPLGNFFRVMFLAITALTIFTSANHLEEVFGGLFAYYVYHIINSNDP